MESLIYLLFSALGLSRRVVQEFWRVEGRPYLTGVHFAGVESRRSHFAVRVLALTFPSES